MTDAQDSTHPTIRLVRQRLADQPDARTSPTNLDAAWLKQLCMTAGADDVGIVEIERPALADQQPDIVTALPGTRALVSFVCRMNADPIRAPQRSVANLEFHDTGDEVNQVARRIVRALADASVRAVNPSMGFPMEMTRFPGKVWVVSHKPVACEAGLGHMGIHRNVIHPRFGNFILLGTVLVAAEVSAYDHPLEYNPCVECKLCVAACPVGAISADRHFNFSACYTHNYREFMGGFTTWVEQIADSPSAIAYRKSVTDAETASMWQSLGFGPNYKSAYCVAVCPAGEDVIGPYLTNKAQHLSTVVKPLQNKSEYVYVVAGSDAESYVERRFPHKTMRRVPNSLRPSSIAGFLAGLPVSFQRQAAGDLAATYHFCFTGREPAEATVVIRDHAISVAQGYVGQADVTVIADSDTWIGFLRHERSLIWNILRRVRVRGKIWLLSAFARCFPG